MSARRVGTRRQRRRREHCHDRRDHLLYRQRATSATSATSAISAAREAGMTAPSRAPGTRLELGHERPEARRGRRVGTTMSVTQLACGASPAGGGVDRVVSPIVIVSAPVDLDHAAAVGLLRWCEAWLHRLDIGEALLAHVLVDVG